MKAERFPEDFVFQLKPEEVKALRSQFATSNGRGGRRYAPYVFTEHGAIMAANVLNSSRAIEMSVFVVRAFVKMRDTYIQNKKLNAIFSELEKKLTSRLDVHEKAILHLITEMKKLTLPPPVMPVPKKKRKMGFGPPEKK